MDRPRGLFVDANVLLELILPNRPKTNVCEQFIQRHNGTIVISMLSVHIVYYFAQKQGYTTDQIDSFISGFELALVDAETYQRALNVGGDDDIEDAMQVAVAMQTECDAMLTLDKNLALRYRQCIDVMLL